MSDQQTQPARRFPRARCVEDWCVVDRDCVELALVTNDEPGCEANIGRLVAVIGEEVESDGHWWLPCVPMDTRPWTVMDEGGEAKAIEHGRVWVRLHDVMSLQAFPPQSVVPGYQGTTASTSDDWTSRDRLHCQPGDLVMVVESGWYPQSTLTAAKQAQIGRIGVVLGFEAAEYAGYGWRWMVHALGGTRWTNAYVVDGESYTVEETVMMVEDERLACLAPNDLSRTQEED